MACAHQPQRCSQMMDIFTKPSPRIAFMVVQSETGLFAAASIQFEVADEDVDNEASAP